MSENKARGMFANVANKKKSARAPVVGASEIEDGDKPFASGSGVKPAPASSPTPAAPGRDSQESGKEGGLLVLAPDLVRSWKFKDRTEAELLDDPVYKDLLSSVRDVGIIEPILVRRLPSPDKDGCQYEEIAGYKRLNAAKTVGIPIKALVVDVDDRQAALLQKHENSGRSNPSAWGRATHYLKLIDEGVFKTQTQLADAFDIDRSYLTNLLRVARKMPDDLIRSISIYKFGATSLIYLIGKLDAAGDSGREALIDRLVEFADDFNAKPEKASSIIDRAVESLQAADKLPASGIASTFRSQKGKTLSVKSKANQVAVTFHEAALSVATVDEIKSLVMDYLTEKGLSLEQVEKRK